MTISLPCIVVRQTFNGGMPTSVRGRQDVARYRSHQVRPVPNIDPGELGADLNLQTRRFTNGFTFRLFRSAPLRQ
jgi:hypothetical protein